MKRRAVLVFLAWLAMLTFGACDSSNEDSSGQNARSDTTARDAPAVAAKDRPPLTFQPVLSILSPDKCTGGDATRIASADGQVCYSLGPVAFTATRYAAQLVVVPSGDDASAAVEIEFEPADLTGFNAAAKTCFEKGSACPAGQLAIVFGGKVRSAPTVQEPQFDGAIQIHGDRADMEQLLQEMGG